MKNRGVAIILCLLFGWLGFHKLYLGQIKTGMLYLLFFWTMVPAILAIVDFFGLLLIRNTRFETKYST